MFSSVIIFCLALCAAYYCKYKDPPAEESMEANSQNESPRILGRFVFGILFTCYMAKDCLKTFFDVVQNYEDDSYIDLISLATDHQRNEYETSDDSDGEHQYSFVEFLSLKIYKISSRKSYEDCSCLRYLLGTLLGMQQFS
ncbi:hypothetical protein T4C_800 [Trichinella pseudospiralis]|uniref:Uncharacterized protein n=1 Tax=Trichinella pseudospiralis TaxID=6337 RepID=A0A0V1JLR5_TRIPS|nr:hypothetical protein T4C_800 [Trichinella pseudospiralis]